MLIVTYDWDGVILIFTTLLIIQTSANATTILSLKLHHHFKATNRSLQRLDTPVVTNGFHMAGDACYTTAVITLKDCKHTTYVPK